MDEGLKESLSTEFLQKNNNIFYIYVILDSTKLGIYI